MRIAPIRRYTEPRFPTRQILDEHPELLALVPKRWRKNPVVIAALTGVCLLLATAKSQADTKAKPSTVSRVAPIFQHGAGRGAFGCVAINPPVFLSEDEARQVIVEESKKAGIWFAADSKTLGSVALPVTSRWPFKADMAQVEKTGKRLQNRRTQTRPLIMDGTDAKRQISYEYVSEADFASWECRDYSKLSMSTVSIVDLIEVAGAFRRGLTAVHPEGTYAIFYDPQDRPPPDRTLRLPHPYAPGESLSWKEVQENREARANAAKALAREDLRKQVQDFIKWLKAQGVI